jgi:c-di-GMP-binding flagellar brake protein YcgR
MEDIKDNWLYIAEPYFRGFFLPRRYNREYILRVPSQHCAYTFSTRLLRYVNDPIVLWVMEMPSDVIRQQRRQYVRLDVALDVELELLEAGEESGQTLSLITKDISGSGAGVVIKERDPVRAGGKVRVLLRLEDGQRICAEGEVLRIVQPDTEEERPVAAIRFTGLEAKEKRRLERYIFHKQIERRKKESELFS